MESCMGFCVMGFCMAWAFHAVPPQTFLLSPLCQYAFIRTPTSSAPNIKVHSVVKVPKGLVAEINVVVPIWPSTCTRSLDHNRSSIGSCKVGIDKRSGPNYTLMYNSIEAIVGIRGAIDWVNCLLTSFCFGACCCSHVCAQNGCCIVDVQCVAV